MRLSRDRIDRLGFFESVTVDTPAVPSAPDQVDVNVTVKERATGNIQLGAGYSSAEGLVLSAGISQQNLFGSGNALSLEINTSKANRVIALAHTDPYVTTEGISRSVEIFYRDSDLAELNSECRILDARWRPHLRCAVHRIRSRVLWAAL